MSKSVDERAVIMEFDNKQFESGIAQSRKSLEQFEKSLELKGASEAIDKVQKQLNSVDFSDMQRNLEAIKDRFSNMGIAGMTVIQNLTNEVVNFAKNGLGALVNKINTAGKNRALNIEKAHFLLQGILKDEEEVQDALDRADKSVTGTAYAYDSAARAAAVFVTTGQRGEELTKSLNAIADLTATVSGNYDEVSHILSKIVSSHKLYLTEMQQINRMGFTLDEYIADYFNAVNEGLDNVPKKVKENMKALNLLGKKGITREDLYNNGKLLTIYSESAIEAIEHSMGGMAKRANETFSGAIENIGAAWSRIGALFWSPLVEQNSELVHFINAIRLNINAVKQGLEPFAKVVTDITLKIFGGAKAIAEFTKDSDGVASAHKPLLELTKLFEAFFNIIKPGLLTFEKFIEITNDLFADTILRRINSAILTFSEWASRGSDSFEITEELEQKLKDLGIAFDKATQPLRDFWTMVKAAFYAVFDLSDTTSGIEGFIDNLTSLFNTIAEGNQLTDAQKGGIFSVAYNIFNFIKNTGTNVVKIIETLGGTLMFAFGELKKFISGFIDFVKPIGQAIKESGILQSILDLLSTTFGKIGEALSGVPGLIGELFSSFNGNADPLENFTNFLKTAKEWIDKLTDSLKNFKISDGFKGFIDFIKGLFTSNEQLNELEETESKTKKGGASSLGVVGFGRMMTVTQETSNFNKAYNAAGGSNILQTFSGIIDSIKQYLLPALVGIGDIIVAVVAIKAIKGFSDFHKTFKAFMDLPLVATESLKNWGNFPKDIKNLISGEFKKSFVIKLIAVIGLMVLCITALLLSLNEIVKAGNSETVFKAAGIIFGVFVAAIVGLLIYITILIKKIEKSKSLSMSKVAPLLTGIAAIFAAIGVMFLLIGGSLMMMAAALKMFDDPTSLFIMFGIVILAVGGIIAEMGVIQKKVNSTAGIFKWWGPTLLALGALFEAVGKTLLLCAVSLKIDPTGQGIWMMAGIAIIIMGLLATISYVAKNSEGKSKEIMAVGAVLAALSLVMIAYATAMSIVVGSFSALSAVISQLKEEKVKESFLYFLGLAAILVVGIGLFGMLLVAMNKLTQGTIDYKTISSLSVVIVAFAGAMKLLVSAFLPMVALLSSPAASAAWEALQMFGLMAAGLTVAIAIIGSIGAIVPGAAAAMIAGGAAMVSMASSILILSLAFSIFVTSIGRLLAVLTLFAQANPEEIGKGLVNFFTGLAIGLKNSEGPIKKGIKSLFGEGGIMDTLWDGLASSAERKAERFGQAFTKIIGAIHQAVVDNKDKLGDIIGVIVDVFRGFMDSISGFNIVDYLVKLLLGEDSDFSLRAEGLLGLLTEILARIATSIPETIWKIMQGIGTIIEENIESIKQFIINRMDDFDEIFARFMVSVGNAIVNSSEPIVSALFYVLGLTVAKTAEFFEAHHDDLLSILGALMLLPLEALSNFLVTNGELILTTLGGITIIFLQWLGILFKELRKWWDEHWEPDVEPFLYNSFMDTLELAAKALRDSTVLITSTAVALGFDIIAGLLDGLQQGMPGIADEAVETIETFRDEICAPERIERVVDAAVGIIENFVNGISEWLEKDENITDLRDSFIRLGGACIKAIMTFFGINTDGSASNSGPLGNLANNILNGIANGLLWAWDNSPLAAVINTVGGYIIDCFKAIFKIESPSKVAFGWGDYIDEGLALGISKNSNKVVRSVDEMTDDVKSSFTTMIEALKMAGDEEFDINPVITPVVDLSNVTDAANMTSRMFNGYNNAFSMSYSTASSLASGFAYNKPTSSDGTTSNSSIVNFTQNNYSPEPLSHYETYRQTKNLLRTIDSRI